MSFAFLSLKYPNKTKCKYNISILSFDFRFVVVQKADKYGSYGVMKT